MVQPHINNSMARTLSACLQDPSSADGTYPGTDRARSINTNMPQPIKNRSAPRGVFNPPATFAVLPPAPATRPVLTRTDACDLFRQFNFAPATGGGCGSVARKNTSSSDASAPICCANVVRASLTRPKNNRRPRWSINRCVHRSLDQRQQMRADNDRRSIARAIMDHCFNVRMPRGSSPVSGSSKSSAIGSCRYAQQMDTFCRMPRDNSCEIVLRCSVNSNSCSNRSALGAKSATR